MNDCVNDFYKLSIEELKRLGDAAIGQQLLVESLEGQFIGVCTEVFCEETPNYMQLEKPTIVSSGRRIATPICVFLQDILSIMVIGVDNAVRNRIFKDNKKQANISNIRKRIIPPNLTSEHLYEDPDIFTHLGVAEQPVPDYELDDVNLPGFPRTLIEENVSWFLIESIDCKNFENCLEACEIEEVICLSVFGIDLCRTGKLAWLCIEIESSVYLLDVEKIGAKEVVSRLKKIFVNDDKIKIMHNGRKFADFLFHNFSIEILNVFDTQATDIYLKKEKEACLLVKSLSSLLERYLKFQPRNASQLFPKIDDDLIWTERPLADPLIVYLIHSVVFLRRLRKAMLKIMHADVSFYNREFITALQRKSDMWAKNYDELLVPPEIQKLSKPALNLSFQ